MNVYEIVYKNNKSANLIPILKTEDCKGNEIKDYINIFRKLKIAECEEEQSFVLAIDESGKPICVLHDNEGDAVSVFINIKDIITFLRIVNAKKFLTIHNHPYPNDTLEESKGDLDNSSVLSVVSLFCEIEYLGEYIITRDGYKKVGDDGVFKFRKEN